MSAAAGRLVEALESALGPAAIATDAATLQAHAVDGVVPNVVCRPADAEQIAAVLRLCAEADAAVVPWGGGTTIALGNLPRRLDVVLTTGRLAALGEHDDANLTATVQAGMTLGALQAALRPRGQFLALDPPCPERATVGGVVAANVNGPRRMAYGGVRDLVIGMKMVLADGAQIKAGGKVVKNVAGYDMCKLFVGSLGTLGIITEVTFKMTPLPEEAATVVAGGASEAAFALVDDLFASTLQPCAIAVMNRPPAPIPLPGAAAVVAVGVEGFTEAVARHLREITAMAARAGLEAEVVTGSAHAACWAAVRDFPLPEVSPPAYQEALLRLTVPLGSVAAAVAALSALDGGLSYVAHAGVGTIWIRAELHRAAEVFSAVGTVAASHRGHAVLAAAPAAVKRDLDIWGPPPPALAIMREIKQRFDPRGLLNPGRFVAFL
ncbi:MAG: FAD-binding oxidoreductase [Armatimonadota bacterium]|nr:FAD-binding oxidoreductase [Armatimonadota bacterium]MDR7467299.1 FAD-binding oxidoreductase [Armatimonadota bacterium]MDR7494560.1 FAD-binding oxidoreductase [Armatimonadota bacterium]MDR7504473.1 FAD-binding oxidoreductase [Armatimonadota bacterium]MDR7553414.1 FAD-binding oxidoreductase [Armatimonadota bacterium]